LQSRHGVTAFFTVIAFLLLLQLVHMRSCWSYIDVALGAMPIQASGIPCHSAAEFWLQLARPALLHGACRVACCYALLGM
jgi:hypothetical protein